MYLVVCVPKLEHSYSEEVRLFVIMRKNEYINHEAKVIKPFTISVVGNQVS